MNESSARSTGVQVGLALAGVGLAVAGVVAAHRAPSFDAVPLGSAGAVLESGDLRVGAPVLRTAGLVPTALELRGITAPVVPVGTTPGGALEVPDPPQTVGWWAPGALPGSGTGTVVVAGHVDSRLAGVGVLAVLPQLTVGERVVLTGPEGRAAYRVVARREFGKAQLPPDTFARTGPPRLVLLTCGGRFDARARSYEDNIVVYAEPA